MAVKSAKDVLAFWFKEGQSKNWFAKSDAFDAQIIKRFSDTYDAAVVGELKAWQEEPESALALIIILDQFSRNIFRDSAKAFFTDAKAVEISNYAITKKFDKKLTIDQRKFLYMPFMHSELLEDQNTSVKLFKALKQKENYDFAVLHHNVIEKFNRFPHRNKTLKRKSTAAEIKFLKTPNSSF